MQHGFQRASLAPDGFAVDAVQVVADRVQILLRSRQPWGTCPDCGRRSRRVQAGIGGGQQICRSVDDGWNFRS